MPHFSQMRRFVTAGVFAALTASPLLASGLPGNYLAARHAYVVGDYAAAADYFGRALRSDTENAELRERAILAQIALGDLGEAGENAQTLSEQGHKSQLAHMATMARLGAAEDYAGIAAATVAGERLDGLSDGLVHAWSLLGQGDISGGLAAFDAVANVEGLGPFASYHKALALASIGDFEAAETVFSTNLVGGLGLTRRAVIARAEILSQLGNSEEATKQIDRAFGANRDPEIQALREALSENVKVPFTLVNSARDGMAEVYFTLASALSNEADDDFSLLYSRLAEHLNPGHVDALLLSAELLENLEQFDLASETYARVPKDDSSYHAAVIGRAGALRAQDKLDEAITALQELTQTHGDLPVVYSTLGDMFRQKEQYAEAAAAYSDALALFDEPSERQWFLYYARGISHERQDIWDKAEADFRAALELRPNQPQVLNYLGYSLVEKQIKLDEALDMIQRAVAAEPNSGYIVDSLGWVLYRLGRYDEAVGHMEKAAELMPIDPVVNDHLGDVYWAVGRTLEAEFMWKRALSFVDWEDASEDLDPERVRRKLEVGLDQVLAEEGAPPLKQADASD